MQGAGVWEVEEEEEEENSNPATTVPTSMISVRSAFPIYKCQEHLLITKPSTVITLQRNLVTAIIMQVFITLTAAFVPKPLLDFPVVVNL